MQTLIKILLRYSNFLVFIALEVAAFMLVFQNNAAPRSSMLSTANSVIAWQNEQVSAVVAYFSLRAQNEQLAAENVALRNQLAAIDSLRPEGAIRYATAKVVQMTTDQLHNYLTIDKGSKDGIVRGQGVRNSDGVVGIIRTVGPHYSVVLPIIHTQTQISCRFTKNDYIGILQWNGEDNRFASLTDVGAHMMVNPGDTIVTSGLSPVFPEGIPVGIVENSYLKQGDSYHTIKIRLNTNFKRLKYVEVVQNAHQAQMEELMHGLD
jgi:rod shape-determining protein MreC